MSLNKDRDYLSNRLITLGDMLSNGDLDEDLRKEIGKEYKQITKQLYPEEFKESRQKKVKIIDEHMSKLIKEFKCKCGNSLRQSRSGSKVAYCVGCNKRYKSVKKR